MSLGGGGGGTFVKVHAFVLGRGRHGLLAPGALRACETTRRRFLPAEP